jgi:hypothetical protein
MTTLELKQAILEAVRDIYHKEYVGKIEIEELPKGYTLKLGFNKPEAPITISAELKAPDFIKFIRKELRERHFELVTYFTGYKYEPEDLCNQNINNSCSCNDK